MKKNTFPTIPPSNQDQSNRRTLLKQGLLTALSASVGVAFAQDAFPARPIRVVVPYPAGGPLDGLVRLTAERLSKRLNQPVIVENKAGASGILGVDAVAKAAPDGYTILATVIDTQVNNLALFKQLPYDPIKDFAPITGLAFAPAVLVVNADVPVNNLQEFVQWSRANRGKLVYGSWGAGGTGHAITEALNRQFDLQAVHAPYRGEGPMVQDLLAKTIAFGCASVANSMQHVEKGTLKAIAVSGTTRNNVYPNVPTLLESGAVGAIHATRVWLGTFAPAKTPTAIVQRFQTELKASLEEPQLAQILRSRGFEVSGGTSAEFDAQIKRDLATIPKLLREIGVEAQ